ncbi:hypothetical protein EUX98_g3690 [Antrodiella citrinella]|uniref:Uncharacterized protein n=1 Tax=Antrodiella citrinella TaxID=2447956 RepID=A0A4S4MVW7_9APHY|nr:hypothetical protein EUX98_g3690 [Antrodiella citrinella]
MPPSAYAAAAKAPSPELSNVPTIPSLPSVSSHRLVTPLRQQVLRPRANTIPTTPASPLTSSPTLSTIPEGGKLKSPEISKDTVPPVSPSRQSSIVKSKEKERDHQDEDVRRGSISTTASTTASPPTEYSTPPRRVTDSPLYGDVMSLRATHEEYVRSIRETHAMEMAELMRRVEQLEREVRKRDREIKGLRWLVMNANNGGSTSDPGLKPTSSSKGEASAGRYRSESKSSQVSQLSTASSGVSGHRRDAADTIPGIPALHSPRTSTEEGLYDLQSTISDLIAPAATPPLPNTGRTKTQSPSPDVSPSKPSLTTQSPPPRLKRANTLPDNVSTFPSPSSSSRSARRTSSPILPPSSPSPSSKSLKASKPPVPTASGAGLGIQNIDIPSIPTASSSLGFNRLSTTDTTLSSASTIPSLTSNVSTASSSALSAIPETSNGALDPQEREKENQERERDTRRTSRQSKRLSASSTTASVGVAKMAHTPSISQMLDKSTESSMDDLLRRLRSFGGHGDR